MLRHEIINAFKTVHNALNDSGLVAVLNSELFQRGEAGKTIEKSAKLP